MSCTPPPLFHKSCYPHPVAGLVELLETHISWVFLAGEYAYKIKKPVIFPFLNFGSLEARRQCCEEELRLNRRTAPYLYLAVVLIGGTASHPRIGTDDGVFEYAVQMRRFDQENLAERLADKGQLRVQHIDVLASAISVFHAGIPPAPADSPYGNPGSVSAPALENFTELDQFPLGASIRAHLRELRSWTETETFHLSAVFAERKHGGYIRECHGDLHLGNIVYLDGKATPFDCIEFNPALRWIDVMSDTAFLAMDLQTRLSAAVAARFLNRYLEATGDYGGLQVLNYYLVYRALVRAKVALIRAQRTASGPAATCQEERYVRFAADAVRVKQPALVIMHGLAGTGKSTIAQALLQESGAIRVRSDVERKRLHGLEAMARTHAEPNGGIYASEASRATYERLKWAVSQIAASGRPAIVDAAFLRRELRDEFRQLAERLGILFLIVSCRASPDELQRRVAQREAQLSDASEAGLEVLANQTASQEPLTPAELADAELLDTQAEEAKQLSRLQSIARRIRHEVAA